MMLAIRLSVGQAMAQANQARRDGMRRALAAALLRLDEEEFGWCDDCGDPIPAGRLRLDPTVQRCVSCASG